MKDKLIFGLFLVFAFIILIAVYYFRFQHVPPSNKMKEEEAEKKLLIENSKVQKTSIYSKEEIDAAKSYVSTYRYIQREINKANLKCITDSQSKDANIANICNEISMKRFNMKNDKDSIARLEEKYKSQLKIALSDS